MTNIVKFELLAVCDDQPTERKRWNGDPMPSKEAAQALLTAVDAFTGALEAAGFTVGRCGYGVLAFEPVSGA